MNKFSGFYMQRRIWLDLGKSEPMLWHHFATRWEVEEERRRDKVNNI